MLAARVGTIVALLAGVVACGCATAPAGAVRIPVSAEYAAWWAEVDACSGIHKPLGDVRVYLVDSLPYPAVAQTVGHRDIYVKRLYADSRVVLEHEFVHARGIDDHPAEYFRGRCGDLMRDGR